MKKNTLAACCGAAMLLAAPLAGCGVDGTAEALDINGTKINMGTANFVLRVQQAQTTTMMEQYGLSTANGLWDQDYTAATSTSSAVSMGENLKKNVVDALENGVLLKSHAEEYKVTIPADLQKTIEDTANKLYSDNAKAMKNMGATAADIQSYLELTAYQSLMYAPMVADTDKNVSDDEAAQTTVTYATLSLSDYDAQTGTSTDVSDDDKKTYKEQMQLLLDQTKKSSDPATADMSSMANAVNSKISVSQTSYGKENASTLPADVVTAAAGLTDGELYDGVIDTGDAYYLVRMDSVFDKEKTETEKQTIISTREQENYQKKLDAWEKDAKVTESAAWKKLEVTDRKPYTMKLSAASSSSEEVTSTSLQN